MKKSNPSIPSKRKVATILILCLVLGVLFAALGIVFIVLSDRFEASFVMAISIPALVLSLASFFFPIAYFRSNLFLAFFGYEKAKGLSIESLPYGDSLEGFLGKKGLKGKGDSMGVIMLKKDRAAFLEIEEKECQGGIASFLEEERKKIRSEKSEASYIRLRFVHVESFSEKEKESLEAQAKDEIDREQLFGSDGALNVPFFALIDKENIHFVFYDDAFRAEAYSYVCKALLRK